VRGRVIGSAPHVRESRPGSSRNNPCPPGRSEPMSRKLAGVLRPLASRRLRPVTSGSGRRVGGGAGDRAAPSPRPRGDLTRCVTSIVSCRRWWSSGIELEDRIGARGFPLRVVIAGLLCRPWAESAAAEVAGKGGAERSSADGGCLAWCTANTVGRRHLRGVMPTPRGVAMIRACRCRTTCAAAQRAAGQPRAVG
jgi:hypothetical protein